MSKLEKQTALPRRQIYRTRELAAVRELAAGLLVAPKPKRKAKKAKGKR